MNVDEMIRGTQDAMSAKRIYGEPIERDGLTIIPAAKVSGGGGGGGDAEHNGGGGFGVRARPVGAYVIKDGEVSWEPALDLNRIPPEQSFRGRRHVDITVLGSSDGVHVGRGGCEGLEVMEPDVADTVAARTGSDPFVRPRGMRPGLTAGAIDGPCGGPWPLTSFSRVAH